LAQSVGEVERLEQRRNELAHRLDSQDGAGAPWGALAEISFSYDTIGATRGDLPDGFHHIRREVLVGSGRECFTAAATQVMGWQMQRRAGVLVDSSTPAATVGSLVKVGVGPVSGVCRVVYEIDEPNRRGFAYGTLQGHPESGEEFFGVRFDPADQSVYAQVIGFSRPAVWWSRAGAPLASLLQRRITERYLAALAD